MRAFREFSLRLELRSSRAKARSAGAVISRYIREAGDCDDSGSGRRDRLIKIVSYFRSMCFYCVILQHLFVFVRDKRTDLSSRQIYKTSSNASLYIQQYDKESSKMSPVHHQV
ncbi:PREDICTED: uncharacterized protein LOC105455011 isoform X2 [Wasmannia auropunctata]|uniref:uncharacterized protein LOC105455011 isoform X2 n=1 Tax=Wasmannia auropunctata TaxID=64793 RepID=UPI0005EFA72D|nr:PREDICTED: uncharacterized protein LOC105455011 isoform X2 [Wasmannia auropunctata]